jgi:transcriptional regulator with XRE-family HTH domain
MRGNHLVREARRRAGLTQTELAARTGTTQSAIARLERGHGSPTLERISKLVAACGFEVEVRLVPQVPEAQAQVRANASLAPAKRIAKSLGAVRLAEELRAAGTAARTRRNKQPD